MAKELHNYRKSYQKGALSVKDIDANPMQQFQRWFFEAKESNTVEEVNAMTLTTIGVDGFPKGRVVLLKKYDENGFYFYTNYKSEKGISINKNPNVSISFFWPALERQIIIKGVANKTSEEDSINYFASRPKGSQLGALVSPQSDVIANREELENSLKQLEEKFIDIEVPKPDHWGGFLISPLEFEFWQGRPNRLHDRIRYSLKNKLDWKIERLAP
ncbi:pyridoxamine 5'-phosphate oxidase [Patiriisocius hiemis]|uniref:Pyridoxine/pyridoxamine 5'-phosphate oxidase n=1 Tax=Patiriisocius hiemis TaxID=3075604 RepID=A0ABU2Y9L0_9FLAO|nr:pyridoxamine 5'-phosphate oxidase [Constantimarinum sp. W242]MDT0554871.1 pyridoxamine 5'-phosphate oxidase [Constantimarinum sp. W242]